MDVQPFGPLWRTRWLVGNDGPAPITLTRAVAPHGRYRAEPLPLDIPLLPDQASTVELDVRVDVTGGEIENAFLILTLTSDGTAWRILTRFRVRMDGGIPQALVERIDVQEVGFNGGG